MKHEIEIEGLPEGWRVEKISVVSPDYVTDTNMTWIANIFLEKIKPRRIVLEETEEVADTIQFMNTGDVQLYIQGNKIWKEVEEGE